MDDRPETGESIEREEPDEPIVPRRVTAEPFDLVQERKVEPLWVIGFVIALPLLAVLLIYVLRAIFGA